MKTDNYLDRTHVTTTIALYEHGIIRNPKTDKCIVCMNPASEGHTKDNPPKIKVMHISFDDVKEALEEMPDGYFDFIDRCRRRPGGSQLTISGVKETDIKKLNNQYLTGHIISLEIWCGAFQLSYPKQ